jgi:hypothetical protein
MVLTPEELSTPRPLTQEKHYLSKQQMEQGLHKRPTWVGWRARWGGWCAAPVPPKTTPGVSLTIYSLISGRIVETIK